MKISYNVEIHSVYSYINDLICTRNNQKRVVEFREAMIKQFGMTNIEPMSYFLEIDAFQIGCGIFFSQKKCASHSLKKFKMDTTKPTMTPIEEKLRLTKEGVGDM